MNEEIKNLGLPRRGSGINPPWPTGAQLWMAIRDAMYSELGEFDPDTFHVTRQRVFEALEKLKRAATVTP